MKTRKNFPMFLFLLFFVHSNFLWSKDIPPLTVAYAANLQYAIKELQAKFSQQHPTIVLRLLSGSSGKHNAQIRNGIPVDIFLSADFAFPSQLYQDGFTLTKAKTYAIGQLVLWTRRDIPVHKEILATSTIKKISLADPKLAPYGKAAMEVLKKSKLLEKVKHKLVYGENAATAVSYIYSEAADIGFIPKSTVLAPTMRKIGMWKDISSNLYHPIEQAMVILNYAKESGNQKNALLFWEFLLSKEAKIIFEKYGYK